jgi:type IV secretory pathway VirJ component
MTGAVALAFALSVGSSLARTSSGETGTETRTVPTFGRVVLYAPVSEPDQVVLFISGDGGWNLGVVAMAERLRDLGALVIGIDIRTFISSLEATPECAYPAGPLDDLSHAIQIHRKLRAYKPPVLVGYSSGATLVYAALAGAPPETFAGAISLGFCLDLEIHAAPCQMRGLKAKKRVNWTPRTPDAAAADLDRVIRHYADAWKKTRMLLVGYSFGADVLPFLVARLPAATRSLVERVTLFGPSRAATFEFRVSSWFGGDRGKGVSIAPEVERLTVPVTCVRGADEPDSSCLAFEGPNIRSVTIGRSHHFSGDYDALVGAILSEPDATTNSEPR